VRDDAARSRAVEEVQAAARELGFEVRGVTESPIQGMEGNVEYLMHASL
jgi:23S rRNA (cytidine1920-2'-O)/16S rRNA (cytidine1409-2'-O)-methyltransferase